MESQYAVVAVYVVLVAMLFDCLYLMYSSDDEFKDRKLSYNEYTSAALATDAGPCSVIGKDMLLRGGSVVDAAIAAMLCVGLYHAHSTGIGGGSYMNIFDATTGDTVVINSREGAVPSAAHRDMYEKDPNVFFKGPSAIAVPGQIAGYWEAHQRFGKLKWKDLFEPSIKLAVDGYRVSPSLARAIRNKALRIKRRKYNLKSIFLHVNGSLKQEGDMIRRPLLAVSLRKIAKEGAYTFYNGSLSKEIVADIEDMKALFMITEDDLKSYRVEVNQPINITIGDFTVFVPGGTSGGPSICLILNILKGYNLSKESMEDFDSRVLTYHRFVEALKFTFAKRTRLKNYRYDYKILNEFVQNMTSDFCAEKIRLKINDSSTQPVGYYGPVDDTPPDDGGTSHLSIIGEDGSAVSMTSSINRYFGSSFRGQRTGILFNNNMNMSCMSPTIIVRNDKAAKFAVKMVVGASGGTTIPSVLSLVIMRNIWFGNDVDEAVSLKRVHHQLIPDLAQFERGSEKGVIQGVKGKNHAVNNKMRRSVVQAVLRHNDGRLVAKCDERKGGYPEGY